MTIGLISDTHGYFDATITDHFSDCDEIWHLGDIGTIEILVQLKKVSGNLYSVYGNIDDKNIQALTEEYLILERDKIRFLLIHIAGGLARYNKKVKTLIEEHQPHALVCGHSHILKIQNDQKFNLLYINPGAAGNQGFHKYRTLIKMKINNQKISDMKVIDLGKRGRIS